MRAERPYVKVTCQYQNTITDWLFKNNIENYSIWVSSWNNYPYNFLVEFENEEDAIAFKLRWS